MVKVIGVKFRNSGRVYYFDPGDLDIQAGQGVVVETARGVEYADVTMGVTEVEDDKVVSPLKPVQRIATDEDLRMRQYYWDKEKEAFPICEQKIAEHGLDMKLVNVEYNLTGSKVVFYFTAVRVQDSDRASADRRPGRSEDAGRSRTLRTARVLQTVFGRF